MVAGRVEHVAGRDVGAAKRHVGHAANERRGSAMGDEARVTASREGRLAMMEVTPKELSRDLSCTW